MIERVIKKLEDNRQKRIDGDIIAIPWSTFPRLNTILPGIQQGKYYLCGARTKVGKTQLTDYLFMYEPFEWWYSHRNDTDITPIFKYFSLEMSSELKWISAISYKLFKSHGIIISPQKLQSVFKDYILDENIISIVKSPAFQHWLKAFEDKVTFYDSVRNATGIFKNLQEDSLSRGEWTYKEIPWKNEDGSISAKRVKDKFVYRNPDEYLIDITDHLGILHAEKGENIYQAIQTFSSNYCIELRNNYNRIPVNVQQLSADSADAAYTSGGKIILDKIRPTDRDLSDNKHTALDPNVLITLFYPATYGLPEYEGWDLGRIGKNHRELMVNLNRDGISNASVQLMFLGACNYFAELPRDPSERVYQQIAEYNKNTI